MNWKVGDTCYWPSSGKVHRGLVEAAHEGDLEVRTASGGLVSVDLKVCCKSENMARELMESFRTSRGPRKYHPPYRGKR